MSDEFDQDEELDESKVVTMSRKDIRALERKAAKVSEAEQRATAAERKLALRDAGIPTSPLGKLFEKAYDGDLDPEAIKAAAREYGVLEPEKSDIPADEMDAHRRMADASTGAAPPPPDDYETLLAQTNSPEEAIALAQKFNRPLKGPQVVDNSFA